MQSFYYRGGAHSSVPGEAVVLHPDEPHDGYAGTDAGFGYRIVYVEPARIAEAVRAIASRPYPLPFVRSPVVANRRLVETVRAAFDPAPEPLALDAIALALAEALLEQADPAAARAPRLDTVAVVRAREVLDAERTRVVHSTELEAASGLTRFELARQFRAMLGTTPYRYSLMRRLEYARDRLAARPTVDAALDAGFADQAHFTRTFKAAFGVTPARYRALEKRAPS